MRILERLKRKGVKRMTKTMGRRKSGGGKEGKEQNSEGREK